MADTHPLPIRTSLDVSFFSFTFVGKRRRSPQASAGRFRPARSLDHGGDSVARGSGLSPVARFHVSHGAHVGGRRGSRGPAWESARYTSRGRPVQARAHARGGCRRWPKQLASLCIFGTGRWRRNSGCASRTRRRRRTSRYAETSPSRRKRKRRDLRSDLGSWLCFSLSFVDPPCFKSSRVSEWLEKLRERKAATVDLYTTNHLQLVDMRKRLTYRFNIDCKEDRRLRETWQKV